MAAYKQFQDPVHGYLPVRETWVERIVDTRYFQRLRNVRQLDTTRVVFPTANHSRFEHSLGVYHLGRKAFNSLSDEFNRLGADERDRLQLTLESACLLHDIGHFPYSHLGEEFVEEEELDRLIEDTSYDLRGRLADASVEQILGEAKPHEMMGLLIVLSEYGESLEELGVDPVEVCAFMLGTSTNRVERWEWEATAQLLSSMVDVDRLDYMLRDDFMSGASLVSVDANRLLRAYTTARQGLALSEKALSAIRNYLDGRNAVYMWITQHHKVVCSKALMRELISAVVDEGAQIYSPDMLLEQCVDDAYLRQKIREHAFADDTPPTFMAQYTQFEERDYLPSCWKNIVDCDNQIGEWARRELKEGLSYDQSSVEDELADVLGLDSHDILTGISHSPQYSSENLLEVYLATDEGPRSITEYELYSQQRGGVYEEIPYVYVPESSIDETVSYIRENAKHLGA